MRMKKFEKFINEAQAILDTLGMEYSYVEAKSYSDIQELQEDMIHFHHFNQCILHEKFKPTFGNVELARWGQYIFMIKKMPTGVIYIETELTLD